MPSAWRWRNGTSPRYSATSIVDHKTYVLASDGDLMEGISQEAIALAGHLKLSKLIVLFDDNGISIDGALSLSDSTDQVKRFEASNWNAMRVDGHDPKAIAAALTKAQTSDRPTLIACKTTIGFGAPTKAGKSSSHGSPLGADEIKGAREALGWTYAGVRSAERNSLGLARRRRTLERRACRLGQTLCCVGQGPAVRIHPPHERRSVEEGLDRRGQSGEGLSCTPRRRKSPPARRANSRWKA